MDTGSIAPGSDWPESIQAALAGAAILMAVVGPDWLRAGSDDYGLRPIDKASDWVRKELEYALDAGKLLVPVLVRDATLPPATVLPTTLHRFVTKEALAIRSQYWDHDVKLLLRQLEQSSGAITDERDEFGPYPVPPAEDVALVAGLTDQQLDMALHGPLKQWKKVVSKLPEDETKTRVELFREFKFTSFQAAVAFISQVAKGCDIANHHPRWENVWKTLRVYLTTWNIGHRISDRDVQLAKYFGAAYEEFTQQMARK
jgi:pterin-4a-carbinolamine dehydratase